MKTRLIALLLVLAMMFTLSACKSADEEDEAMAGNVTPSNNEDDSANDDSSSDDSSSDDNVSDDNSSDDNSSDDSSSDDSSSDNNSSDNNSSDDTEDDKKPPLSSEGKYTITFDYAYNDKIESEKTDGKITEINPSRAGYEFQGWFKDGKKWDFSKSVTSDTKLVANWKIITYTITYVANGATLPSGNPTTYTVDSDIKLKPASMTGKVFDGWEIKGEKETYCADTIARGTIGNLTLSPTWDESAIVFGRHEQDGNTDNGKEQIVWIKLAEKDGKTLLMTKDIIDVQMYDKIGGSAIKWVNCDLRDWLNKTFYKSAFLSTETPAIVQTTVVTPGQYDGSTSKDYVFILSIDEVSEYLTTYAQRRAKLSVYSEENGAQNSPTGGWWWLRNKISDYGAALVENDGNIRSIGYTSKMTTIGVRPCIWVDMSKIG